MATRTRSVRLRGSMHEDVTSMVRGMIVRHELKPGEWIAEAAISEKLGVSRTPLREALKALAAEKLVVLHPFRGAAVTDLTLDQVTNLFEVQAILEGEAVELACQRASDQEIAAFAKQHQRMIGFFKKGDRKSYFALNQNLHIALVAMSKNHVLVEIHAGIIVQIERARFTALDVGDRWHESIQQHEAIFQALKDRNSQVASTLMRQHVRETGAAVRASLAAPAPVVEPKKRRSTVATG